MVLEDKLLLRGVRRTCCARGDHCVWKTLGVGCGVPEVSAYNGWQAQSVLRHKLLSFMIELGGRVELSWAMWGSDFGKMMTCIPAFFLRGGECKRMGSASQADPGSCRLICA